MYFFDFIILIRVDTHAPVTTPVDVIYPLLLTSRLTTFVHSIPHLNLAWV
jgi:hypothetical protein